MLTATQIRELARRHGVQPSKALGQNFVIDPNTIRKIIRSAQITATDRIVEVGAGFGALTVGLAEASGSVIAIEKDRRIVPALREVVEPYPNVTVVEADAMSFDLAPLLEGASHRLVANLPYNIATPLVADLLIGQPSITDLVVMVQKEVGERLVSGPGSKAYGAVSVLVAYMCSTSTLGKIPPTVFWPPPKVESILIRLTRRAPTVDVEIGPLMKVVRAAFAERRKTIRNSIASALMIEPSAALEVLERAGVPASARAESLTLEQFAAVARELQP